MKSRICLLGLVVFFACLSPGFGRSWTDNQGKRISANFKEVYRGNVYLIRGTKTVAVVPFFNLSKADRDYVKAQLEKSGKTDLLPKVGEQRVWTDLQGRAIEAQFVGLKKRNVVVLQNDKVVEYVFSTFSVEDQEYVKKQMEERGQGNLVPTIVRPSANSTNGSNGNIGSSSTTTPSGHGSQSSAASRAAASRARSRSIAQRVADGETPPVPTPFSSGMGHGASPQSGGSSQTYPTPKSGHQPPQRHTPPTVPTYTPTQPTQPTYTPPTSSASSSRNNRRTGRYVGYGALSTFLFVIFLRWLVNR